MKTLRYGLLATVSLLALTGCEQKISEKDLTKDGGVYSIQEGSDKGFFKFKDNHKLTIYSNKKKEIASNVKYKITEKDDQTLLTLNMEDSIINAKNMQYANQTTYVIPKNEEKKGQFIARMDKQSHPYYLKEESDGTKSKIIFTKNKISVDTSIKDYPVQYICNSDGAFSMKAEGLWMTIDKLGITDIQELDIVKAAPLLNLSTEEAKEINAILMHATKKEKEQVYQGIIKELSNIFSSGVMKKTYKEMEQTKKDLFNGNQVITFKKENKDKLK